MLTAPLSIHLTSNHRPTDPQTRWNLNALWILKGASTLTHVVLVYTSLTLSTGTAHATISQISTSSPIFTPLPSRNLSHSNPWAVCKDAVALSISTLWHPASSMKFATPINSGWKAFRSSIRTGWPLNLSSTINYGTLVRIASTPSYWCL